MSLVNYLVKKRVPFFLAWTGVVGVMVYFHSKEKGQALRPTPQPKIPSRIEYNA